MPQSLTADELLIGDLQRRVIALEALAAEPHPAPVSTETAGRALGQVFTPNPARPVLVAYTVELSISIVLGLLTAAQCDLLSDGSPTPSTVRASAYLGLNLGGLGLTLAGTIRQTLLHVVGPGENVLLSASGAGSTTLISAIEVVL